MMRKVLEKTELGGIEVNNRIVRSATGESRATEDGFVNEDVLKIYSDLAEGRVGLIITGTLAVAEDDIFPRILRIHDDAYIEGLKKLSRAVRENDGKIIAQIGHGGTQLVETPPDAPPGPSAVTDLVSSITAREMTRGDIGELIRAFGEAAWRVRKAELDGVQLHAAHGYLLSKFLTPYYNRRNDEYGGSIKNRARILIEILEEIKYRCGPDFPVFIKVNSQDFLEKSGGLLFKESFQIAGLLAKAGFDSLEISGGITYTKYSEARENIDSREKEAYFKDYAKEVAEAVSVPVILVGGIRSLETIEEILNTTRIAAAALCRPLIREPGLIKRWLAGNREKSRCLSCNRCFDLKDGGCLNDLT